MALHGQRICPVWRHHCLEWNTMGDCKGWCIRWYSGSRWEMRNAMPYRYLKVVEVLLFSTWRGWWEG